MPYTLGAVPPLVINDALSLMPCAENELLRTYTLPTWVIRFCRSGLVEGFKGFSFPKK